MTSLDRYELSTLDLWDEEGVSEALEVMNEVLGGPPRTRHWFLWKHRENPQGPSIIPVAFDRESGRMAAVRALWNVELREGNRTVSAYQPCDTATRADFRRQGLFIGLTRLGLREAEARGAKVIFNFPNQQSRGGYAKLGWHDFGGLSLMVRPFRFWRVGSAVVRQRGRMGGFVDKANVVTQSRRDWGDAHFPYVSPSGLLRGRRDPEYLQWRFGRHPSIHYHLVEDGESGAVGRVGHRGGLVEFFTLAWLGKAAFDAKAARGCVGVARERYELDLVSAALYRQHPLHSQLLRSGFLWTPFQRKFVAFGLDASFEHTGVDWAVEGAEVDTY